MKLFKAIKLPVSVVYADHDDCIDNSSDLLPLSLALGEGGEAQAPMARVVIGGLLTSTVITLILIPVIYSYIEEKHIKRRMKKADELKAIVPAILLTFLITPFFTTLNAESNDTLKLSLQDVLHRAANNNPLVRIENRSGHCENCCQGEQIHI